MGMSQGTEHTSSAFTQVCYSVTNVTTFVTVLVPFFAGLLVGSVWRGFVDTRRKRYKFRFCCFALPFDHLAEEGERRWVEHFRSDLGPMWLEFVISSLACPWLCLPNSLHVPYGTWRKSSCFCFLLLFTSVFVVTPSWYLAKVLLFFVLASLHLCVCYYTLMVPLKIISIYNTVYTQWIQIRSDGTLFRKLLKRSEIHVHR